MMQPSSPVPRPCILRLSLAALGTLLFLGVSTLHGAALQQFDPWHQSVSALALGPHGWIQTVNFLLFGAVILTTVPVWRRVLAGGAGATSVPILTTTLGISLVALALIPQDPAPGYDPAGLDLQAPTPTGLVHLAVAAVMAGSSVGTMFVLASRFSADAWCRGWATYSRVMALLTIGAIAIYGVWSTQPSGFAGTFERAAAVIPALWLATLLRRLWAGAPFMYPLAAFDTVTDGAAVPHHEANSS